MDEKKSVKNLKEVIGLVFVIVIAILKEVKKDGFQVSDLFVFLSSQEFQSQITPAIEGVTEIPAEVKDMDANEGIQLGVEVLFYVKAIIEIFKK